MTLKGTSWDLPRKLAASCEGENEKPRPGFGDIYTTMSVIL